MQDWKSSQEESLFRHWGKLLCEVLDLFLAATTNETILFTWSQQTSLSGVVSEIQRGTECNVICTYPAWLLGTQQIQVFTCHASPTFIQEKIQKTQTYIGRFESNILPPPRPVAKPPLVAWPHTEECPSAAQTVLEYIS